MQQILYNCIRKPQVISDGGGGGGVWDAHPLHPTPRSAPVCGFKNVLIRVDGAWVACVAADPRNVYTIGSVYTLYSGDLECLRRRRLGLS